MEIKSISKDDIKPFIDVVNNVRDALKVTSVVGQQSPTPSNNDTVSQLERLASLYEKGILTEEEFQAQKSKILKQ